MENNSDITNNFSEQNNDNLATNLYFSNNRRPNTYCNYDKHTNFRQNHFNNQTYFRGNRNKFSDINSSRNKNDRSSFDYSFNENTQDCKHKRNSNSIRGAFKMQRNQLYLNDHRNGYTDRYKNNHPINGFSNNKYYDKKDEVDMNKIYRSSWLSNERNFNPYNNNKEKSYIRKKPDLKKNFYEIELDGMNQRDSLIWQLNHNKYECMICVTNIRAETRTWSCDNCYHIFHIHCIKKWATTCGGGGSSGGGANQDDRDGSKMNLRCPACQKEYSMNVNKTVDDSKGKESIDYRCFCGKQINPIFQRGGDLTPHSCDDTCGKSNRTNDKCPHLCVLMCHPGPCPPCEAIVTRKCQCERTRITAKCNADERTMVCGEKCGKYLNCGVHQCEQLCHPGECDRCEVEIEQKCWCERKSVRIVICGGVEATAAAAQVKGGGEGEYSCDNQCSRTLECGNHQCGEICHSGDCTPCSLTVDKISRCWCKKSSIDELDASCQRESCVDPVPSCGEVCERIIDSCGHVCSRICHEGQCGPCPLTRDVVCRCGKTTQVGLACSSLNDNDADDDETNHQHRSAVLCNKVCNKKLSCGRHRCSEKCCASELHICFRPCGRTLSCKSHQCERECGHLGLCPSCPNVSFDELHCECGAVTLLPPVACGQSPPVCNRVCSRQHECSHPVRHNCHNEQTCPPCTELTKKSCPGNHKILENVYCFLAVATCGLPCGRALEFCEHSCNRICHQGDCITDGAKCCQPCPRLRTDCGHPCSAPCHNNDCQEIMTSCMFEVSLICACKTRSISMACCKLQNTISIIKFNTNNDSKRDNLDLILSSRDNSVSLPCDNECKKNARDLRLAEAFDISITTSSLNTHYSDSIKNFFKKNIEFLIQTEKALLDLTKNGKNNIEFKNYTGEKADFINRYAACFKFTVKCTQSQNQRHSVFVELNRSNSCIPKPLLSELLKIECPDLFPSKTEMEKNKVSTTNLAMSFADKIRLSKRE